MIEIILDASQLEVIEACPHKWYRDHLQRLTTKHTNPALSRGSFYHEVLKYHYSTCLEHRRKPSDQMFDSVKFAQQLAPTFPAPEVNKNPKFHLDRLRSYFITHMSEDDAMRIIAVEQGFSTLLYEDAERRYILEGMIDLISIKPHYGLTVTDHKTQSRFYDKFAYNHQALNYLSFTGANYFEYNYIGLQAKQSENTFRRPIFKPHPGMLEQWRTDVRDTFNELYTYIKTFNVCEAESDKYGLFPRRRSACDGKFGVCQFHKICTVPDDSPWRPIIIQSAYREKEEWKAWS